MAESFTGSVPGQDVGFAEVHERNVLRRLQDILTAGFNETSALGM